MLSSIAPIHTHACRVPGACHAYAMSEDLPFIQKEHGPSHYYGDIVRALFVTAAVLILLAQVTGTAFLTAPAALLAALILVVSAGLTNPVQVWIQWTNTVVAALGLLISGNLVLNRYESGELFTDGIIILLTCIVFLVALYYSTRTLRGILMRGAPVIK